MTTRMRARSREVPAALLLPLVCSIALGRRGVLAIPGHDHLGVPAGPGAGLDGEPLSRVGDDP
ncbi:hypothetical protein [Candidatus Palauibacter polyketidifaciens]|uniref:hypothetical protein n=1 Tax=Candidatus Palauibacter polyketidifaciens TaxID=3056740 RepID=UPI00139B711D|nr:hypothetical protein [Candidatus Palauibacter polyketidifaciens]MDE2720833.1 hypothetical protein [Candidatus Palauibacter polyketidifaciens]MYE34588.1 hypothetical protein [Gemmatimonadales bacterium]